jgi:adenosylhomocysteinase
MINFSNEKLTVTKSILSHTPKMSVIGILHVLTDTQEFISHLLALGHEVPVIFAKPFSKNVEVIANIERMGVRVEQLDYDTLENTSILNETISRQLEATSNPLILIDVGGYFAKPLSELTAKNARLPIGVLEVTTFGHNRYIQAMANISVPVISIARSEIKDVEATFVGESAWLAVDSILREVGISAFGKKVGVVGYGMIGRRVAAAARANGTHTIVFDKDPLKLLEARSFRHTLCLKLEELLNTCDIVISATGTQAISIADMKDAHNGIILASAGSKANELDLVGIRSRAKQTKHISKMIAEYKLPSGKVIYILRNGAAVNFLVGSCPDETMDLVFAEMTEGCKSLIENSLDHHVIHEVNKTIRQRIATEWLALQ